MRTVFIIEDDFYMRDIYSEIFKNSGYEVITASEGDEAINKVEKQKVDVILLDIMLPKKNGIEVLKILKSPTSTLAKIPVFMLTNLENDSVIKDALKMGAEGFFLKVQMTPGDIFAEVNTFLDKLTEKENEERQ